MGFGISGLINKFTRPALVKYIDPLQKENLEKFWGVNTIPELKRRVNFLTAWAVTKTITPDVKKSETHNYKSNVTQQAVEDGSIIAEHIIQQPISITLSFEETNNTVGARFAMGLYGPQKTFDNLVEIWEKKCVCEIITEHKIYENMVIQNIPIQHRAPYRNSIIVTCDFTQLNFTKSQRAVYVGKDAGLTKSASQTKSGGSKKLALT